MIFTLHSIYIMLIFLMLYTGYAATVEECMLQLQNLELNSACFNLLLSKTMGYSLVLISVILKFPQIIKIFQNKSVAGISLTSFYIETLAFTISAAFGIHRNLPLNTFGEHLFISGQCFIQIILFWVYGTVLFAHKVKVLLFFFGVWVPALFGEHFPVGFQIVLPEIFWTYIPLYVLTMNIVVKTSQIRTNYVNESTGNLSFVTNFFNTYGTLCRIVTSLVEVKDPYVLTNYLVAFSLNVMIVGQFWVYWDKKAKLE